MNKVVTQAKPSAIDLVVAPLTAGRSDMTLLDLAKLISGPWVRIANAEYRAGPDGPTVSLIAKDGRIVAKGEGRPWPVFASFGDRAEILDALTESRVRQVKLAISAGPWLVRQGHRCNISEEIARGGYTGLRPSEACERAAIGIAAGGTVFHLARDSATLDEMASEMQVLGCSNAISLDGGGSTCVADRNGTILIGYSSRKVCCGLVFREVLDEQRSGGERRMIVCLDPGHGGNDPGAVGPGGELEKDINLTVAQLTTTYLSRAGHEVILTRRSDVEVKLADRAKLANDRRADIFVSIHANQAVKRDQNGREVRDPEACGIEAFHYPGSTKGVELAQHIIKSCLVASGLPFRRIAPANFQVLRETDMPAVLVELGFLSNEVERCLLREVSYLDKYALGIAFGIMNYFRS